MKKIILALMMVWVLALSACGEAEESKKFEKTTREATEKNKEEQITTEQATQTTEATTEVTTEVVTEATSEEQITDYSDRLVAYELKGTDNSYINELLNMTGEYTDSVDNTGTYHYQIPQFNADSDSANTLNQRIEADLYKIVESEVTNMDGGFSLMCYSITYEVFQYGEIVAIVARAPYPNDCNTYFAYTYDFGNDKELTNSDLLAMNSMSEVDFVEKAVKMGEDSFMEQANAIGMTDPGMIEFHLSEAREQITVDIPMYLDENGVLNAYVPFPAIAGASTYDTLCQFN